MPGEAPLQAQRGLKFESFRYFAGSYTKSARQFASQKRKVFPPYSTGQRIPAASCHSTHIGQ